MGWILLALTILAEVAGTTSLKLSEGFTRLWPSILMVVCYGLSFAGLNFVLREIPVSVAYAVWAGAGTALIAAVGMVFFSEPISAVKLVAIGLIIVGVVLLNLSGGAH